MKHDIKDPGYYWVVYRYTEDAPYRLIVGQCYTQVYFPNLNGVTQAPEEKWLLPGNEWPVETSELVWIGERLPEPNISGWVQAANVPQEV